MTSATDLVLGAAWTLLPAAAALVLLPVRVRSRLAWIPAAIALAGALLAPAARVELPWLMLGSVFVLDPVSRVFLAFTALLWGAAAVQSHAYLADDPARRRHAGFFLAAMAGNLGLVVAGDLLTFLSFFALMSFATYGLVVHTGTAEARRAGRVYLALVVTGEVLLFSGLALAVGAGGAVAAAAVTAGILDGPWGLLAGVLLFAGFGIKAGALPLQGWLPLAHPVAPAPASAVMSGAMIKAGLLGWLRFLPLGEAAAPAAGQWVVVLGLLAAFYAAAVGVTQRRSKAVLAYSSISQMGLITVGVGAGLAAPDAWPVLLAAVALYAVHHALAKGALFMGVGVLSHGGGRRAWALLFVPALALAGAPLTSGAVAKTGLKGALEGEVAGGVLSLLALAAAGTTLLMVRFLLVARSEGGLDVEPSAEARAGAAGHGAGASRTLGAGHGTAHGPGLWAPWLVVLAGGLVIPWLLAPGTVVAKAFAPATLSTLLWPIALGLALAALAFRVGRRTGARLPAIPQGDYLIALLDALGRSRDPSWIRRFTRDRVGATTQVDHDPTKA